eukprot:gene8940-12056_t
MRVRPRTNFQDCPTGTLLIKSDWNLKNLGRCKDADCQTPVSMYEQKDMFTQYGIQTEYFQEDIDKDDTNSSLLEVLTNKYNEKQKKLLRKKKSNSRTTSSTSTTTLTIENWKSIIEQKLVTIDGEVVVDGDMKGEFESFVEFVNCRKEIGIQTASIPIEVAPLLSVSKSPKGTIKDEGNFLDSESKNSESKFVESKLNEGKYAEGDDTKAESKNSSANLDVDDKTINTTQQSVSPQFSTFIDKVSPMILNILARNSENNGNMNDYFDNNSNGFSEDNNNDKIIYWKTLSVDLEKRKVVYPDFVNAKHVPGVITKCASTRNKERIYTIEYEDGSILTNVREEYIRLIIDDSNSFDNNNKKSKNNKNNNVNPIVVSRLQEGIRVHAKIQTKSGVIKYLPGRIVKAGRGLFDVECEGNRVEKGLTTEDLLIGLQEGQQVEARLPKKISLQCTGLSWNATGSTLAASYGRNDLQGWCDYPGAICCWNIFSKTFSEDAPDFVLDHPSCIMCVCYHPLAPALIAGGSFNGEVIIWDLTNPEQPLLISPIIDYSHKDPVLDLKWMYEKDEWLLVSAGADGKVLYWSMQNKLSFPVKGVSLSKGGGKASQSKRTYPVAYGATVMSFSKGSIGSSASTKQSRPNWLLVGQEGGSIVRGQVSRIISGPRLTTDLLKTLPPVEDVFPNIKKGDDTFHHLPHIGAVTCIDCSPFHRNLFLSSGSDGSVRLFNMLDRTPLRQWEPTPPSGTEGVNSLFSPISAVQFSPIRPLLFAATSSDGFLYIYDMSSIASTLPVILEAPLNPPNSSIKTDKTQTNKRIMGRHKFSNDINRVCLTGVAFNHKQRDLIAACDYMGRVHIWKLTWKLANLQKDEITILNSMTGNINSSMKINTQDEL